MVITMVNFLNTVNMGRLEETRAQSHTRSQAARTSSHGAERERNLSFLVLASPVIWFPTYSRGRGKIWA